MHREEWIGMASSPGSESDREAEGTANEQNEQPMMIDFRPKDISPLPSRPFRLNQLLLFSLLIMASDSSFTFQFTILLSLPSALDFILLRQVTGTGHQHHQRQQLDPIVKNAKQKIPEEIDHLQQQHHHQGIPDVSAHDDDDQERIRKKDVSVCLCGDKNFLLPVQEGTARRTLQSAPEQSNSSKAIR